MDGSRLPVMELSEGDIPWVLDLAERCYRRKLGKDAWAAWIRAAMKLPNVMILRGQESFLVATAEQVEPDDPTPQGRFPYWGHDGSNPRELFRLFDTAERALKQYGAKSIWLRPTTGADATPIARALGYTETFPMFRKEL